MKSRTVNLLVPFMGLMLVLPLNLRHAQLASESEGFPLTHPSGVVTASLTDLTVTNLNDNGPGSLRQAIMEANTNPGPDVVNFNVNGTITLTTGQLFITDPLTINGPGSTSLTVSGNNTSRVLVIGFTSVTIANLTISNGNVGDLDFGGGINSGGTLTIINCTLSNNSAAEGGAISNSGGTLTITNSTLSGNTAGIGFFGAGGGIRNFSGTVTITNSTLSGNSIADGVFGAGGGIYNYNGPLTISNSTLSGNFGGQAGGGIYATSGTLAITNSTLSGNTIINETGGGIYNDSEIMVKNSIIANNTGGDCFGPGTLTASGVNFSTDSSCPGFTLVTQEQLRLGPLQNNGGSTQTHGLLSGSVAMDRVIDCTDVGGNPVTTDQRGVARPLDGDGDGVLRCDAGAYEAQGIVPFDLCLQDESNGYILKIKSVTGEYQFTDCLGLTLGGTGILIVKGSTIALHHYDTDRRVLAKIELSVKKATASIQVFAHGRTFTIIDRNTANNICDCTQR